MTIGSTVVALKSRNVTSGAMFPRMKHDVAYRSKRVPFGSNFMFKKKFFNEG